MILFIGGIKGFSYPTTSDFHFFVYNFFYVSSLAIISSSINEIMALSVFLLLLYWPDYIKYSKIKELDLRKLYLVYIYAAVFLSIGVLLQLLLYKFFGVEVGKVGIYGSGSRVGFGFIWKDFSFLSLYLVSAIPLVFGVYKLGAKCFLITILLVVGSVATSARTGIFSLFLVLMFLFVYELIKIAINQKTSTKNLIFMAMSIFLPFIFIPFWAMLTNRKLTLSGSGRLEGYLDSILRVIDNPLFGKLYNVVEYKANYIAAPHNIFIFVTTFGGFIGLVLFAIWLSLVFIRLRIVRKTTKMSLLILLIGLQLIPSYYSAYFVAVLLSLAIFEAKSSKLH